MDFLDKPPSGFEIEDAIATWRFPNGERQGMRLRDFRIAIERANRALCEYDARKAKVIRLGAERFAQPIFRQEYPSKA